MKTITLREVEPGDLPVFFEHQRDPEGVRMAAFTAADPEDRDQFDRHWRWLLAEKTAMVKTILVDGEVAGHILSYEGYANLEVSYWLGRAYWGKGIATQALGEFLELQPHRPLYGRAAKDNVGSVKVMLKNGFRIIDEEKGFANARGREIEELILVLAADH
jgi:RimJ/RimL family protein N-acetyltransferase